MAFFGPWILIYFVDSSNKISLDGAKMEYFFCKYHNPVAFPNLTGSEGFDKIITPDKLSRINSPRSFELNSCKLIGEASEPSLQMTVASIEEAISDSRVKCAALKAALNGLESTEVEQLRQSLEQVEVLLKQLKTQV